MNLFRSVTIFLCVVLGYSAFGQTNDMDKELSNLADKLALQIKDQGKKKVAVIDFTDLQGSPSGELGKYIAEELTVNLVMVKRDFSVLDRANLRKLLAEHKLTSQGLIDPENAKKIGMFAGVDALILGTIIPKSKNISLNAKIITTDTAEIVGAAKAEFKLDEIVQQLISTVPKTDNSTGLSPAEASPPPARKPFGDLQAKVESLKLLPSDSTYGYARLTLIITNTSDSKTYGVAMEYDPVNHFTYSNSRGDNFQTTEVTGIEPGLIDQYSGAFSGSMTDIPPKSSIIIVSKSYARWNGKSGDYRPYRLQTLIFFGEENLGRYQNVGKFNLVTDIK